MLATIGSHRFDVTHDAVLVATAAAGAGTSPADVIARWSGRPDAVLVEADEVPAPTVAAAVAGWSAAADLPVMVRTSAVDVTVAALGAGAVAVHDPSGLADPGRLDAVLAAGASLILGCPAAPPVDAGGRAARLVALADGARAAGMAPDKVIIDVTRGRAMAAESVRFLDELPLVAAGGRPVMVVVVPGSPGPAGDLAVAAAHAVVLPRGVRIVTTDDVRTTRRVARVVAELLRTRQLAGAGG